MRSVARQQPCIASSESIAKWKKPGAVEAAVQLVLIGVNPGSCPLQV